MLLRVLFRSVILIVIFTYTLSGQSLPNYVPSNGLVGWWPFNGDTLDYVGTNDIRKNLAVFTSDRNGTTNSALSLSSTYLELPHASYLDNDDFSIAFWVNGGSTQGDRCFLKKGEYSNAFSEDYYLGLNSNNQFHIGFKGNNSCQPGQGWATATTTSTSNSISWNHIVFIHSEDTVRLYQNSLLVHKYYLSEPHGFCGNASIAFGSEWNGSKKFLNGDFDDIGFWSRGLTETEITALYSEVPAFTSCSLLSSSSEVICQGDSVTLSASSTVINSNVFIDTMGQSITSNWSKVMATIPGKQYKLRVGGEFTYGTYCPSLVADPAYTKAGFYSLTSPSPRSLSNTVSGLYVLGATIGRPSPDVYNANTHTYEYYFTASGTSIEVGWNDQLLGDNCGSAGFALYEVQTAPSLLWSTGDATTSITVAPIQETTYWVTNGLGCYDTAEVRVIDINIIGDSSYCIGTEVELSTNYKNREVSGCDTSYFNGYDPSYVAGSSIPGYTYKGLHNGNHYYLANNPTKWTRAAKNAKDAGGHLVCVNDPAEQAFVQNLSTSNLWIGLYRNTQGAFEWVNCDTLGYTNWRSGEPGAGEPYTHILTDNCFGPNQWNDLGDSSTNGTCYSNCYGVLEIDPASNYTSGGSSSIVTWNNNVVSDTIRFAFTKDTTIVVTVEEDDHICSDSITLTMKGGVLNDSLGTEYICSGDTLDYFLPSIFDESILWYDNDTSRTKIFNNTGKYYVQGLDSTGCYVDDSLVVILNEVNIVSNTTTLCPNEEIELRLDTNISGSKLLWSTLDTLSVLKYVPDTSASVWVRQTAGLSVCFDTVAYEVSQLQYNIDSISSYNGYGVRCFGSTDGAVFISASSSYLPVTYSWSDSTFGSAIQNITGGDYWFKVTDSLGCELIDTVNISEPLKVTSLSSVSSDYNGFNVSCNGLSDGHVAVQYQGGVPGYKFYVNGSLRQAIADTLYGFNDGEHIISIVDSNGCSTQDTVTFLEPSALLSNLSSNASYNGFDISCYGLSDGSIFSNTTGGVAPYKFSTQLDTVISNIAAGSYNVQTEDLNGCIRFDSITLTQPSQIIDQSSIISNYSNYSVSCNGSTDGKIELDFYGGVGPYQYSVNGVPTTSVIVGGLGEGSVSYQVVDNNACSLSGTLQLTEPPSITLNTSLATDFNGYAVSCYGASDGAVAASSSGGTGQFSYVWNTLPAEYTASVDSLTAGVYVVSVTDSNSCYSSDTVIVNEPDPLFANAIQLVDYSGYGVSCFGSNDGAIYASVSGGVPQYNFIWNSGQFTQDTINNLAQGNYSLTVLDGNGCKSNSSITLSNPQIFTTSISSLTNYNGYDIKCNGSNSGIMLASSQGGVGPYNYQWQHVTNMSPLLSNQTSGQYKVSATDGNGCIDSAQIVLSEPQPLSTQIVTTDPICYLDSNGTADIDVLGGVGPYSISWSNGHQGSFSDELWASTYYLTIVDTNDCIFEDSLVVTDSNPLEVLIDSIAPTCNLSDDGYLNVMPTGGFPPYSIVMNGSSIPNVVEGVNAVPLYITVTDNMGCDTSVTLDFSSKFDSCLEIPNMFSPNNDNYNDTWIIQRFDQFDLRLNIYSSNGQLIYQTSSSSYVPWDGRLNSKPAPNGDYYYFIDGDFLGEVYKGYVTIIR